MKEKRKFSRQEWHDFGKRLLNDPGGDDQKDFLKTCLDREKFLNYIGQRLGFNEGNNGDEIEKFNHRFTEMEFIDPPPDTTQQHIWGTFRPIHGHGDEEIYADCGFWGFAVRDMVDRKLVEPSWLAANLSETGQQDNGYANIENALDSKLKEDMDRCVRRVLRSMCNPAPRGSRIVFNDFSLGKSWWRWYWAETMSEKMDIDRDEIFRNILTKGNYSIVAAKMHSKRSYISPENVFGGLLLFLNDHRDEKLEQKRLGKLIDLFARESAWRAVELRSPAENRDEFEKLFQSVSNM